MVWARGKRQAALMIGTAAFLGTTAGAATPAHEPVIRQMSELKIAATIPVGKRADWVAFTPTSLWIGSKDPNAVSEIDPNTNRVTATVLLPGVPCAGLAIDGDSLWVPLCGPTPQLAQVDLKQRSIARILNFGPPAGEGGITVGAGSIWLVTDKAGSLARVDPVSGAITQTIALPAGSYNPVFSDGRIFVTRFDGAEVTIVDAATAKIIGQVPVGGHPRFMTAGAGAVWALSQQDGTLSRIDVAGKQPVLTLPLQIPGFGGDIAYGGGRVWTTLMKTPLTAVDAATSTILCQWKGPGGDSLGVGHGAVWLTNLAEGTVSRINFSDLPEDCGAKHP
jgi:DNA-binding beta-propeller fold protein YncE